MGIDVDILHTITPQEGEDYLAMLSHGSEKVQVPASETEVGNTGVGEGDDIDAQTRDMEMDEGSEGTGSSGDSPLARMAEDDRGRSREWSRIPPGGDAEMEKDGVPPPSLDKEEKVDVKKEESPMLVV
jgi:hypothetical protein